MWIVFYLIIEVPIQAKNIRVSKVTLNLHFASQLMLDL